MQRRELDAGEEGVCTVSTTGGAEPKEKKRGRGWGKGSAKRQRERAATNSPPANHIAPHRKLGVIHSSLSVPQSGS